MLRSTILYPFLFGIYCVLFLYANNIESMFLKVNLLEEPLIILVIIISIIIVLFFLLRLVFKKKEVSGIILTLILFMFFSYGHLYNLIKQISNEEFFLLNYLYFTIIYTVVFVGVMYLIIKANIKLSNFTLMLNTVSIILIVISIAQIIFYGFSFPKLSNKNIIKSLHGSNSYPNSYPNIYYIILDSYSGYNTLKNVYGYDNQEFLNYLKDKGFYVASCSTSNYPFTGYSLPSSLNMEYLGEYIDKINKESIDSADNVRKLKKLSYQIMEDNKVVEFLKFSGYTYVHISSLWGAAKSSKHADITFDNVKTGEFSFLVFQTTMLRPFQQYLHFYKEDARKQILSSFKFLSNVHKKVEGPFFVFAHILSPHPPYLFGKNGENVNISDLDMNPDLEPMSDMQKQLYLNQLIFINKKLKELIDCILYESQVPPIIIIQSDHGMSAARWDETDKNLIKQRMEILNAYYLPNNGSNVMYPIITPVNSFRLIFNYYLNTNFEQLEDRNYFGHPRRTYQLNEVTDVLNEFRTEKNSLPF